MVAMLTLNYLIEIQQKTFNCSSILLPVFTKKRFDLTELENLQCQYNTIILLAGKKKKKISTAFLQTNASPLPNSYDKCWNNVDNHVFGPIWQYRKWQIKYQITQ